MPIVNKLNKATFRDQMSQFFRNVSFYVLVNQECDELDFSTNQQRQMKI